MDDWKQQWKGSTSKSTNSSYIANSTAVKVKAGLKSARAHWIKSRSFLRIFEVLTVNLYNVTVQKGRS